MSGQRRNESRPGRGGRTFLALVAVALLVALARSAARDPGAAASLQDVRAGDQLDLAIRVEGAVGLAAFEAGLRFDPAVVRLTGVRLGAAAPQGSALLDDQRPADGRPGSVMLGSYNAASRTMTGAGTLAIVSFEAIGDGEPGLGLDAGTAAAFDLQGRPIPATFSLREGGEPVYLPSLNPFQVGGLAVQR